MLRPAEAVSGPEPKAAHQRRRPTATSSFGVGRRETHDASTFYARFTPPSLSDDAAIHATGCVDTIWHGDASRMDAYGDIADESVALVVTSPPYFAGKEYEESLGEAHVPVDYGDYLVMLHDVFDQCLSKLEPGGRIAVNVANLGRKPYRSLSRDVIDILERMGYLLWGEIIWRKSRAAGGSCAWGTYQRPGNPVLRDVSGRIVVACKGRFDRAVSPDERAVRGLPCEGTITKDEFIDATLDVWDIPSESATRVGHPAPFPVELPRRLIELFTYRGDLILDPFMGSGSTALAALRTERLFIGFDTEADYVELAIRRIELERSDGGLERSRRLPRVTIAPRHSARLPEAGDEYRYREQGTLGHKASELAVRILSTAGFVRVESGAAISDLGLSIDFRARDANGAAWLFELSGAYSASRPGLRSGEVVWRSLGKASVVHQAQARDRDRSDLGPFVLLSTELPLPRTAPGKALAAAWEPDGSGPVRGIIELLDPEAPEQLRALTRSERRRAG
ncbi:MAG: DNA-methyltransferase [Acidimicrobiales bacterium]